MVQFLMIVTVHCYACLEESLAMCACSSFICYNYVIFLVYNLLTPSSSHLSFPEADYTLDDSYWNEESTIGELWNNFNIYIYIYMCVCVPITVVFIHFIGLNCDWISYFIGCFHWNII
jgi:hypothetical protein